VLQLKELRQNRLFALCFRSAAFLLSLAGLLSLLSLDISRTGSMLLYYTNQSNILVIAFFGVLVYKTAVDLKNKGKTGDSSYFERLSAAIMIAISVTMLVFWVLLVPASFSMMDAASESSFSFFSFANLQLHLFTPLLMIADYILFTKRGKLQKYDPFLFTLIPIAYFIQATILGFSGVIYRADPVNGDARFPYFFIDYDQSGGMVAVYVLVIAAFFIGVSYGILYLDKKYAKK
jgi:hypothetical protein